MSASATTISNLIKDLQKLVIEGNTNPHTLLAKELSMLNSNNFSQENKQLKSDILDYLTDVKGRIESLTKVPLGNYSEFESIILDKYSYYVDIIRPKINDLLTKVKASTGDFSNKIVTDIIIEVISAIAVISNKLNTIKSEANKLKNNQTNTTPTSVANSSRKNVDDYIKELEETAYSSFMRVNNELKENGDKISLPAKVNKNANNVPFLTEQIQIHKKHINLVEKYENDILNFNITPKYTKADIDKTLEGLKKDIQTLTELLKIAKGEAQDSKPTPSDSPTVETSPTTPTKPDEKKPEIPLTPEQWGIKFTIAGATTEPKFGKKDPFSPLFGPNSEVVQNSFYMDLLPARQSTIPVQGGRDVPNAMPGLNYKLITQVGKQAIPGFSPVYQNLGIKGMQVTIVGAFTGGDGSGSTKKTDTPEAKSKTPWLNSKGSPSTSDSPDRGGNLPELTAYNSYTEFVQLCQQGKHMEVEINLFQIYNQSTTTQIGQDVKLQSENGNPKFTGIVRSLDVYHATKERTWYTLIMDVTDFGMASKEPINLNNKLEEAIKAAQAELDKAKEAEAADNQTSVENIQELSDVSKAVSSIPDKISKITDPTKRKHQSEIYAHFLETLNSAQTNPNRDINKYNGKDFFSTFKSSLNGTFTDIEANFIGKGEVLIRTRIDCRVLAGVTGVCESELYWHLNPNNASKPITKFLGKGVQQGGSIDEVLPSYTRKTPQGIGPHSYLDGTSSELNSLLNSLGGGRITDNEWQQIGVELVGCVIDTGVGTFFGPGGIAVSLSLCGLQGLSLIWEKFNNLNQNDSKWKQSMVSDFITARLLNLGMAAAGKYAGKTINKFKQGGTVKGASSTVAQNVNKSVTFTDDIANILRPLSNDQVLGKIVQSEGVEYTIISLNRTPGLRNVESLLVKDSNGKIKTLNLNQIDELDITLRGNQPSATSSNSTNSSTATSSGAASNTAASKLAKKIEELPIADNVKQYLKTLSTENQAQVIALIKRKDDAAIKNEVIEIFTEGGGLYKVAPTDQFKYTTLGIELNGTTIPYESILSSKKVIPKSTNPPVKSQPVAPTSQINNLINALDTSIINSQAKASLIANANDNFKTTVFELLNAKKTKTLSQYYVGNDTTKIITDIIVSENNIYLYYSDLGVDSYSFTENLSGKIKKVQSNTTSSSQPSIPQQQTTQTSQTQQPSTGGSSQGSVITPPVGLTGQALTNFKTLIQFNGKQLVSGKEITISYKRITNEEIVTRQIKSLTYNTKIETFSVLDSNNKIDIIEPSNIVSIKLP